MEYIVLDLEWNQSNTGKEDAVEKLPFEIIEIEIGRASCRERV